jgi:hypothetical protein
VKRAEDTQRRKQEEEKAIAEVPRDLVCCLHSSSQVEALDAAEERERAVQAEQDRRAKQAAKIALRFSLFMQQLNGVSEDQLIQARLLRSRTRLTSSFHPFPLTLSFSSCLQQLDADERTEEEAHAAALAALGPPSPRKVGDKTIAEGGKPKKLK